MNTHPFPAGMKLQVLGIVHRKDEHGRRAEKGFWTRIGVAFVNRDGSFNLRLDYHPTDPETILQMRPFTPKEEDADEGEEASP
jgi:hypothetical protein